MNITLELWAIPLVLTSCVWSWAFLSPGPPSGGDYNFGPSIDALMKLVVATVITLFVWLVYFAAVAFGAPR